MRISDWSSDVCSSDLIGCVQRLEPVLIGPVNFLPTAIGIGMAFIERKIGGRPAAVLPLVDQTRQQPRGPALLVAIAGVADLLQETKLVVGFWDREIGLQTDQLGQAGEHSPPEQGG